MQASQQRNAQGPNNTLPLASRLLTLRAQKARLLGYPHHTNLTVAHEMAQEQGNIQRLLQQVAPHALKAAKAEQEEITPLFLRDNPHDQLQAHDWEYYAELS